MTPSCILFVWTILVALVVVVAEASVPSYIKYTAVTGFFLQDDPSTDPATFDFTTTNFGLINRTYDTDRDYDPEHEKTQWQRFQHQVFELNRGSGRRVQYKVLYLGRHGEGYHNVAESHYGTHDWDLDGNGTIVWADAHLTANGIKQAQNVNAFWKKEIAIEKIPVPERYYTSPLSRCLATANITFTGLELPDRHPFVPKVKEKLRETMGVHTCDHRSSKTYIHRNYPSYKFELGFTENDKLWIPDLRESDSAQTARSKELLDNIFSRDRSKFISFTSHSGEIAAILRVINHPVFGLVTGAAIPVLVKAKAIYANPPSINVEAPHGAPVCTPNPTAAARM
ncbi:MAG: hypothetical protein M1839_006617 [Geoglossum umbratile]|nr:MAG: hypothetical protein M1839_006617 [Geoglossum umbratile]